MRRQLRVQCTVRAVAAFSTASSMRSAIPRSSGCATCRSAWRQCDHSRQAGIFQPGRQREGPHRRRDDHRDGEGRRDQRRYRSDRTDFGQYRDRARVRRCLARLSAEAGDAGIDVDRAAQDAGVSGRRNCSDAGRAGHERLDRHRRRAGADHAECGDAAAVQESRQPGNSPPHHGRGNLERYRRQYRLSSSPASAPAAPSPGSARC